MPYRLAPPQHAPVPLRAVVAFACAIFLALVASAALLLPELARRLLTDLAEEGDADARAVARALWLLRTRREELPADLLAQIERDEA